VPRVHFLAQFVLLHQIDLLHIKLVLQGCLVFAAQALIEMVIEVLLLNAFFQFSSLLHRQVSEANLVFERIDSNFKKEAFCSV